MNTRLWLLLIWVAGGLTAITIALQWLPASHVDGTYVPVGHDSFYHARRILDAIASPADYYQFDDRIHAPEGSWLTWPWAYDLSVAWLYRLLGTPTGVENPLALLVYLAPLWSVVNVGLILLVGTALNLSVASRAVAVGCYALSPLTQELHAAGMLDHHFVEHSFVLTTLLLGILWMKRPSQRRWAILLALALGAAPTFHNGLFVLQVPILATLLLLWLRDISMPPTTMSVFSGTLALTTALGLLPSSPFRNGEFSFYTLSWFHLYVAFCTGLVVLYLAQAQRSRRSLLVLAVLGTFLVLPLLPQILRGGDFLVSDMVLLDQMAETQSVLELLRYGGGHQVLSRYTALLALLPLVLFWAAHVAVRNAEPADVFFAVSSAAGSILFLFQLRLHYFGSFALYMPMLVLLDRHLKRYPPTRQALVLTGTSLLLVLLYLPAFGALRAAVPLGMDYAYALTHRIYPRIAQACQENPGIVLAEPTDGHYIRYHTSCAVMANNMIMTEQHERKLLEVQKLFASSPERVRAKFPHIRYVYVRRNDNVLATSPPRDLLAQNAGLRQALLFGRGPAPEGYELLSEITLRRPDGGRQPLARFYRINR